MVRALSVLENKLKIVCWLALAKIRFPDFPHKILINPVSRSNYFPFLQNFFSAFSACHAYTPMRPTRKDHGDFSLSAMPVRYVRKTLEKNKIWEFRCHYANLISIGQWDIFDQSLLPYYICYGKLILIANFCLRRKPMADLFIKMIFHLFFCSHPDNSFWASISITLDNI